MPTCRECDIHHETFIEAVACEVRRHGPQCARARLAKFMDATVAARLVAESSTPKEFPMEESEMSQTTNADDLAAQQKRVAAIVQDEMNRTQHGRSNDVRVDALEAKVDELVHTIAQLEQQVQQLLADVQGAG